MAKQKIVFVCSECGQEAQKWVGRCPSCGQWNTMKEFRVPSATPLSGASVSGRKPAAGNSHAMRLAMKNLNLSARAYERILKMARTIADLDGSPTIGFDAISEAIGYRNLDRGDWAERGI